MAFIILVEQGIFFCEGKEQLSMFGIVLHKATVVTCKAKKLAHVLHSGRHLEFRHGFHFVWVRVYARRGDAVAEEGQFTEAELTLSFRERPADFSLVRTSSRSARCCSKVGEATTMSSRYTAQDLYIRPARTEFMSL